MSKKRILQIAAILTFGLAFGFAIGCKTTVAPPLPPAHGYANAADQQMGEILAGARRFYLSIQQQATPVCPDGQPVGCSNPQAQLILGDSIKAAFNDFGVSLNAADAVYLAYHNGTATEAQAQAAVNTVQSKQAALPLPGAK